MPQGAMKGDITPPAQPKADGGAFAQAVLHSCNAEAISRVTQRGRPKEPFRIHMIGEKLLIHSTYLV